MRLCGAIAVVFVLAGYSEGDESCWNNLPDSEFIADLATVTRQVSFSQEQRLFPGIRLTCSGAITRWVVAGKWREEGRYMPELQIWRRSTSNTYALVSSLSPARSDVVEIAEGVFEIVPKSPMSFGSGYSLGLFHPPQARLDIQHSSGSAESTNYYYDTDGFTLPPSLFFRLFGSRQSNDQPLVYVETDTGGSGSCTEGFTTLDSLLYSANLTLNISGELRIFPGANSSCPGIITNLTLAASPGNGTEYPHLQLWRRESNQFILLKSIPIEIPEGELSDGTSQGIHVYSIAINRFIMYVEVGDVIGLYQPHTSRSRFTVAFVRDPVSLSYVWSGEQADPNAPESFSAVDVSSADRVEFALPLIAPQLSERILPSVSMGFSATSTPPSQQGLFSTSVMTSMASSYSTLGPTKAEAILTLDPSSMASTPSPVTLHSMVSAYTTTFTLNGTRLPMEGGVEAGREEGREKVKGKIKGVIAGAVVSVLVVVGVVVLSTVVFCRMTNNRLIKTWPRPTLDLVEVKDNTISVRYVDKSNMSEPTENRVEIEESGPYEEPNIHPDHTPPLLEERRPSDYEVPSFNMVTSEPLPDGHYDRLEKVKTHSPPPEVDWGIFVPTGAQRKKYEGHDTLQSYKHCMVNVHPVQELCYFTESAIYWKPASNSLELYDQLAQYKYREISRKHIQITEHLGSGQFGTVNKGLWHSPMGSLEVAVKMLQSTAPEEGRVKFLQEAAIMGQFRHPNVVKLHGVVTVGKPVMIILELMKNGDLKQFLLTKRPIPGEMAPSDLPYVLLDVCRQVVSGMVYLSGKAFVHRDLAARNILLSEGKTCKIADFGLARDLDESSYYISHGGQIPIKWTAPEALHYKKYSTASDVWSFGCLMYEIWSLGHIPFEGRSNQETLDLLSSDWRHPPPPGCPIHIYKFMMQCWHPNASDRPSFNFLQQVLSLSEKHLLSSSSHSDVSPPQALMLGAPLEVAHNMYPHIQTTYRGMAIQ